MGWLTANFDVIMWIVAAVVLFIVELMTISTISICFVGGALLALALALLGAPLWLQLIGFVIASVTLIFTGRKFLVSKLNNNKALEDKTRIEGKLAIVSQEIKPGLKGQVELDGVYWTAASYDDTESFKEGSRVVICKQDGTSCYVEKYEEMKL